MTSRVPATTPDVDPGTFWASVPRRALEWRESEDGRCVLLRPRFGTSRIGRWLAGYASDPHYRIRLDEIGTFVWKACDGETSLAGIADRFRDRFGDGAEPAEPRLAAFVRLMQRARLLELAPPSPLRRSSSSTARIET